MHKILKDFVIKLILVLVVVKEKDFLRLIVKFTMEEITVKTDIDLNVI